MKPGFSRKHENPVGAPAAGLRRKTAAENWGQVRTGANFARRALPRLARGPDQADFTT
jgi:hypothetical protein